MDRRGKRAMTDWTVGVDTLCTDYAGADSFVSHYALRIQLLLLERWTQDEWHYRT